MGTPIAIYNPVTTGYVTNDLTGISPATGVVAAHHILVDVNGNALGSAASPFIVNQSSNVLSSQGKTWIAATGVLNLTAAGNLRITFQNPVGSGVTAVIGTMTTLNTGSAAATANFFMNPTGGLPTATGFNMNGVIGFGSSAKCTIKGDTSLTIPVSGGTQIMQISVPQGRTVYNSGQFIVPAGQMIGMNLVFAGAAAGELVVYYAEV